MENQPKRRRMDTSGKEARHVVEGVLQQFAGWRNDLARYAARADRRLADTDRHAMLARCASISAELMAVRMELLRELAGAPARVAGHSRVVDVEKALDGVEAQAAELRRRLS